MITIRDNKASAWASSVVRSSFLFWYYRFHINRRPSQGYFLFVRFILSFVVDAFEFSLVQRHVKNCQTDRTVFSVLVYAEMIATAMNLMYGLR